MNPYADNQPTLKLSTDLFKGYKLPKKQRVTERGELLKEFSERINKPIGYIAMRCRGLSLVDLYYMKSAATQYEKDGKGPYAKAWYGMLKQP